MSAPSAVLAGQDAAESLMLDTCTIKRASGTSTNTTTGVVTPTYTTLYTGSCKIQAANVEAANPLAGPALLTVLRLRVDVPLSVTGIRTGDIVTLTAVRADGDAELVGKSFRVLAPFHKSFATARRLPVEEVVA